MRVLILLILGFCGVGVYGQTCCSGGVPMSGNIGLPIADSKAIQLSTSYDLNLLKTLKSGNETLNDQSRERTTQTFLLQAGYQVTDRLAVEILLPYIIQKRIISQFGNEQITQTHGIGDMALLVKYAVINHLYWTVRSGIGLKVATGRSDKTNNNITLNADLQPGSGANDLIFWSALGHGLALRPSTNFHFMGVYRLTGVNENYLNSFSYRFGNELSLMAGLADQFTIGPIITNPSLTFRYRHVQTDTQNDFILPNTGGKWIFFRPGIILSWWRDMALNYYSEIPIWTEVGGVQLSPTVRHNIGILTTLKFGSDEGF
tara:strand:+ start:6141 stop:7091 length:951 start_codon:yes stop_codon:yes gene_type:complete